MTEYLTPAEGLSPLARGNQVLPSKLQGFGGPIPARAGQPLLWHPAQSWTRAYPRSRGATDQIALPPPPVQGLSPLARGNRDCQDRQRDGGGPIPARAGQPSGCATGPQGSGAYPRSRGATAGVASRLSWLPGLSPLARGNRALRQVAEIGKGPIPARAGQPVLCCHGLRSFWAYPRSRGATTSVLPA